MMVGSSEAVGALVGTLEEIPCRLNWDGCLGVGRCSGERGRGGDGGGESSMGSGIILENDNQQKLLGPIRIPIHGIFMGRAEL